MASKEEGSNPFENFSEEKLTEIVKASDALDQAESRRRNEENEEEEKRRSEKKPYRRLRKSPLEMFNRSLFLLFLGSFLFSFVSVYATTVSYTHLTLPTICSV